MDTHITPNVIAERSLSTPDAVLLREVDGPELTYRSFHQLSLRWSSLLETIGVRAGDRVISMVGGAAGYWTWIGTALLGAQHVPADPDLRGQRLQHVVAATGARVLVVERTSLAWLATSSAALAAVRCLVVLDGVPEGMALPFTVYDADDLLARSEPRPRPAVTPAQVQAGIFTSGTTGPSKCVLRTWETYENAGSWLFPGDRPEAGGASAADGACYSPWPPFHTLALTGLAAAVQRGLRLVVRRGFSLSRFWPDVRTHGCTHCVLIVVAPLLLHRAPSPDDADNSLRYVTMVPLTSDFGEFGRRFGVAVSAMYGQSETGPLLAAGAPADFRTTGRPVAGIEARIVGPDGTDVGRGETGELLVRRAGGGLPFSGYLSAPGAAPEQGPADGWFPTGDAFRRDDRGNFQLMDRIKDYIRHRGHNVSSVELEQELLGHPSVAECAFVGVRSDLADPGAGAAGDQDIKAVVVVEPGATLSALDVVRFLEPRLPRYMLPRYVDFVGALPRTATLKTRKAELRNGSRGTDVWKLRPR